MPRAAPPSKWVDGVSAEMPTSAAAQTILGQRLQAVLNYLPLAARDADDDIEYVHQLRVWTRRSTAALDLFQDLVPAKRRRLLRKQLRQIRRAAGRARDLDVMLERFHEARSGTKNAGKVVRNLEKRRRKAQQELIAVRRLMKLAEFKGSVRRLLKRTRWTGGGEPNFGLTSCELLEQEAAQFFLHVSLETSDPSLLHEMRLDAKRFRYAAEIVAPVFGKSFRKQFYPELVSLQDALGSISDRRVAGELFESWSDKSTAGRLLRKLSRQERESIAGAVAQLHDEWPVDRFDRLRHTVERHIARKSATASR